MTSPIIVITAMMFSLILGALTGCSGDKKGEMIDETDIFSGLGQIIDEEKRPLTIYHISDDEIELH